MTSASVQPKIRSAAGFQNVTLPSRSTAQIASGDDWTRAWRTSFEARSSSFASRNSAVRCIDARLQLLVRVAQFLRAACQQFRGLLQRAFELRDLVIAVHFVRQGAAGRHVARFRFQVAHAVADAGGEQQGGQDPAEEAEHAAGENRHARALRGPAGVRDALGQKALGRIGERSRVPPRRASMALLSASISATAAACIAVRRVDPAPLQGSQNARRQRFHLLRDARVCGGRPGASGEDSRGFRAARARRGLVGFEERAGGR